MKVFEEILLRENLLDPSHIDKNIKDIKVQIDYYAAENISTRNISLLPIRNLLKDYSDQFLRDKGYLLTVKDLNDAFDACVNLAIKDPVLANSQLKRWHYAFKTFTRAYEQGLVKNETAVHEMQDHFLQVMRPLAYNKQDDKVLPNDLLKVMDELLESNANNLFSRWQRSQIDDKEIDSEIHDFLIQDLVSKWHNNHLEFIIKKALDDEKEKNHSTQALVQCYRQKNLPIPNQNSIYEVIIDEINKDVRAKHLKATSALGAEILYIRQSELQNDDYIVFGTLIANWQTGQLSGETTTQLESYIERAINKLNLAEESSLNQQFSNIAINIFINKLKAGEYPDVVNNAVKEYGQELLQQFAIGNGTQCLPCSEQAIETDTLLRLHEMWVTAGQLTAESTKYISSNVFNELNNKDNDIRNLLWSGAQYRNENAELRQQLTLLQSQLASIMGQLNLAQQPALSAASSSTFSNEKNDSKEHSHSVGFFK